MVNNLFPKTLQRSTDKLAKHETRTLERDMAEINKREDIRLEQRMKLRK